MDIKKELKYLLGYYNCRGLLLGPNDPSQQLQQSVIHHGRTLLSNPEQTNYKEEQSDFVTRTPDPDFLQKAEETLNRLRKSMEMWSSSDPSASSSKDLVLFNKGLDSICPTYFNTSESQR